MKDLKTQLYFTVRGHAKKSVQEIADDIGISSGYLYRATDDGDSSCRFPLELLIPLMQATGDTKVLDHLCQRMGSLRIDLKKVAGIKKRDPKVINGIYEQFAKAWALFLEFAETPQDSRKEALKQALYQHLCNVAALQKSVDNFKQQELF